MQLLYENWCECGGHWTRSSWVVSMRERHRHRKTSARVWMTFAEIAAKYQSEQIAMDITLAKLQDEKLCRTEVKPHPDCPENPSLTLFLVWDRESEINEEDHVVQSLFEMGDDESDGDKKKKKKGKKGKKAKRGTSSSTEESSETESEDSGSSESESSDSSSEESKKEEEGEKSQEEQAKQEGQETKKKKGKGKKGSKNSKKKETPKQLETRLEKEKQKAKEKEEKEKEKAEAKRRKEEQQEKDQQKKQQKNEAMKVLQAWSFART